MLQQIADGLGLRCELADGPESALEILSGAEAQDFDVLLLDVRMPGMDGFALSERIRLLPGHRTAPIVMLTSSGQVEDKARSLRLGISRYLMKPVRPSELREAILTGIGQQAQMPRRMGAAERFGAQRRVLLAEDNRVNQKLAAILLRQRGFEVITVEDGEAAVDAFAREAPDLILMDIQMPRMDGYAAMTEIRRRERIAGGHVPIVALTAHALEEDRRRCFELGADGYLSKPIRAEQMMNLLRRLLEQAAVPIRT